jgi:hypothetical protein
MLRSSIYRFMPLRLTRADLAHMHGRDERVAVEDCAAAIHFYAQ